MKVKVSICIPCFNQTEFLRRNLESILNQDFTDYEIIMSDDSTSGDVEALVTELLANKKLVYSYSRNKVPLGSPANWNHAISQAQGDYIKIMHHDDWFSKRTSLSAFVRALDENVQSDFVFCDSEVYDVQNKTSRVAKPSDDFLSKLQKDSTVLFMNNQIGAPSAMMFRANKTITFDEKISYLVDIDFYMRSLNANPTYSYIHESLIVNTTNLPTQVTAASVNKKIQIGEYCYLYNKTFAGEFPKREYRIFFRNLFSWYQLGSFHEISEMGSETPKPEWIFRWLLFLSRFKAA
ncbi:MAG: glycosyltransferase family 2 protein [bacterium]|nr:glycosyltransferase family 2 protein [bacterium]